MGPALPVLGRPKQEDQESMARVRPAWATGASLSKTPLINKCNHLCDWDLLALFIQFMTCLLCVSRNNVSGFLENWGIDRLVLHAFKIIVVFWIYETVLLCSPGWPCLHSLPASVSLSAGIASELTHPECLRLYSGIAHECCRYMA